MPFRLPSTFRDFTDPSCPWLWVALLTGLLALLLAGAALVQYAGITLSPNALDHGRTGQMLSRGHAPDDNPPETTPRAGSSAPPIPTGSGPLFLPASRRFCCPGKAEAANRSFPFLMRAYA